MRARERRSAENRNGTRPTSGRTFGMHSQTRCSRLGDSPVRATAYRDPALATIPASRAMRTKSESDDACIFVIRLAR